MKRILMLLLVFCVFGVGIEPVQAKIQPTTIQVGKARNQYDWIQGITATPQGLYILDGDVIKVVKGKSVKTYYDLQKIKPILPKEIRSHLSIRSFTLGQIQWYKGELYLSGFMFQNTEKEKQVINGSHVLGKTYNVIFKLKNKKPTLIHHSLNYYNMQHEFGDFYETPSGKPEDIYLFGDTYAIAFAQGRSKPFFTFSDKGGLIFTKENTQVASDPWVEIWQYKNNKETKLHTVKIWQREHVVATLKKDTLTVYYDYVPPGLPDNEGYSIQEVNMKTKKIKTTLTPPDVIFERPIEHKGKMYFLSDDGIVSAYKSKGKWQGDWIVRSKNVNLSVYISGWDYDGKYVYITDFERRAIHRLKP